MTVIVLFASLVLWPLASVWLVWRIDRGEPQYVDPDDWQ